MYTWESQIYFSLEKIHKYFFFQNWNEIHSLNVPMYVHRQKYISSKDYILNG